MKRIVLASASPRRRELLSQIGVEFEVKPADGEERIISTEPSKVVEELSGQKAMFTAKALEKENGHVPEGCIVLGADTIVSYEGRILGKPSDKEDAIQMLSMLQGNTHQVYTGVTVLKEKQGSWKSIRKFVELCGVSKANSSVDYAMLEYCIREDLKLKRPRMMAVLDPIKLVIDNYPEGQVEYLEAPNNMENEELGTRKIPFSGELYIERDDFMAEPPKKYKRLYIGNEVRLMNAYFVTCTGYEADDDGTIRVVHCTYDPETKGGNAPDGRKVKGTIHWVEASNAGKVEVRLYENIVDEEKGVYNKEDGSLNVNPNSLTVTSAYVEPELLKAKGYDSYQFVRNGFFCADIHDSKEGAPVFNRIVSLKSSFKLPKA